MKFGVFSLMQWPEDRSQSDVFRNELDGLSVAEEQGYDSAWLGEHDSSRSGIGPAIHLTSAHLAARTTKIRIGAAVTIVPFLHPLRIAEELAVLDVMSGGRMDWAASPGYPGHQAAGPSEDSHGSDEVFREQIEIVLRAWTGEPFAFEGQFFQFPELQCAPTPVQDPHPPVWITASSRSAVEWAAQRGYSLLADSFAPISRIADDRARYLDHFAEHLARQPEEDFAQSGVARRQDESPALRHVYVGESLKKAREEAGPALLRCYGALARVGYAGRDDSFPQNDARNHAPGQSSPMDPNRDPDAFLRFLFEECVIVGDDAYCHDKLQELREQIDLDHLMSWQNFGNLPHEASMASQRRLIEKVAPSFR